VNSPSIPVIKKAHMANSSITPVFTFRRHILYRRTYWENRWDQVDLGYFLSVEVVSVGYAIFIEESECKGGVVQENEERAVSRIVPMRLGEGKFGGGGDREEGDDSSEDE